MNPFPMVLGSLHLLSASPYRHKLEPKKYLTKGNTVHLLAMHGKMRLVINITFRSLYLRYALNRRPGWALELAGRCGEKKTCLAPTASRIPDHPLA